MITLPTDIEAVMPYRGPCGLCGGPDARHRVLDAIAERVHAGDGEAEVAADYGYDEAVVEQIAANWRWRKAKWGAKK